MMNKKTFLVLILVAIAALLAALLLFDLRFSAPEQAQEDEPAKEIVRENIEVLETPVTQSEEHAASIPAKSIVKQISAPVKKTVYTKTTPQTAVVKEPIVDENIVDTVLVKEEESKEIVIPTEYKFKSPAKYLFK